VTASLRARVAAKVGPLRIDVDLDTAPGTLVIVGPNGSGKTSLLSLLLGVLPAESARIEVGGELVSDTAAGRSLPIEHRRLGYVPQDYALFPHLSVEENVAFGLSNGGSLLSPNARDERVARLLCDLDLAPLAARRPRALSGGERQRLALARALAISPRALLLDEPLAALDVTSRGEVRAFLSSYLERLALPTLVVTHDPEDARRLGHSIAVLEAGRIIQTGAWEELVARPASEFVRRFVG
jgi:molybdate transport system ATP-binding protein